MTTTPDPDGFYTPAMRKLQEEHDSRPLADAVVHAIVRNELEPEQIGFITSRDYFFLSTVSAQGEPTVSYKGGAPGMVHVVNPTKLLFPNFDGNGMFFSLGNVQETSKIGMLFIDMVTPLRVRVQGTAKITKAEDALAKYPGANMIVEVDVDSVFYNCARYIHKHERVETSKYVPDENGEQPYPAWKRIDGLQDALPAKDRGRAASEGGTITEDEYNQKVGEGTS